MKKKDHSLFRKYMKREGRPKGCLFYLTLFNRDISELPAPKYTNTLKREGIFHFKLDKPMGFL
jgi:hypothetical protein